MKAVGVLGLALVVFFVGTAESCTSSSQGLAGASSSPSSEQHASPTPTPTPPPTPAVTPLTFTGQGSKVTEPFNLQPGNYRVSWSAQGSGYLGVFIHGAEGAQDTLVNEVPPKPASGEAFFRAAGGSYFLEIKASTLSWTITFAKI